MDLKQRLLAWPAAVGSWASLKWQVGVFPWIKRNRYGLITGVVLGLVVGSAAADVQISRGPQVLIEGTTIRNTWPLNAPTNACDLAFAELANTTATKAKPAVKRFCRVEWNAKWVMPAVPVDAVYKPVVTRSDGSTQCPAEGFYNVEEVTTYVLESPAVNGGKDVKPPDIKRPVKVTCVPPPVPTVKWIKAADEAREATYNAKVAHLMRFQSMADASKYVDVQRPAGVNSCWWENVKNAAGEPQDPHAYNVKSCLVPEGTLATSSPPTTPTQPPVTTPVTGNPNGIKLPAAASGASVYTNLRVRASGDTVTPDQGGVGAFRNPCGYSHMAFDDPIVYPGKPGASHLHVFFGNTSTNGNTTTDSLTAAKSSTCAGGVANLSAYWTAAIIDFSDNTALSPAWTLFYYKSGYNTNPKQSLRPFPKGLRVIAGNKVTESGPLDWGANHYFTCTDAGPRTQSIPVGCKTQVFVHLTFQNCWDGVNLDSPDHRSHMTYSGGGSCPSTHPVALAVPELNVVYDVAGRDTSKWRLSSDAYDLSKPGGYSMHGDIWFNWQEDIAQTWTDKCVRASNDCHAFLIGDGRELY